MKVTIRRSGGLAGLVEIVELDTDGLPGEARRSIEEQVEAACRLDEPPPVVAYPDGAVLSLGVEQDGSQSVRRYPAEQLPGPVADLVASVSDAPGATHEVGPPGT